MRRLGKRQSPAESSPPPNPPGTPTSDANFQISSTPALNGIETDNVSSSTEDITTATGGQSTSFTTSRVLTITDPAGSPTVVTLPPITNVPAGQESTAISSTTLTTPTSSILPSSATGPAPAATTSAHASGSGLKHSYLLIAILVPVLIVFLLLPLTLFALWFYRRRKRTRAGRHQSTTSRQHLRSESGGSGTGARTPTPMEMSQYQDHGHGRESLRSKDPNVSSRLTDEPMTPPMYQSSSGRDSSRDRHGFDLGFHFGENSASQVSQVERNGRPSLNYERAPPPIHDPDSVRDSDASGASGLGIGVAHGGDSWYMPQSQDNPSSREVRVSNEMPPRRSEIARFSVVSPSSETPERSSRLTRESGISDIVSPMSERNSRFHRRSDHEPVSPIQEAYESKSRPHTRRSSRGMKKNLPLPHSDIRPESDLLPAILAAGTAASATGGKRNSRRPGNSSKRSSGSPPKLTSANLTAHAKASSERPRTAGHDRHLSDPPKSTSPFSHPEDDDDRSISDVSGVMGERDPDEVSFVSSLGAEELERRKSERSLKRTASSPGEGSKTRKRSTSRRRGS